MHMDPRWYGNQRETLVFCRYALQIEALTIIYEVVQSKSILLSVQLL